MCKFFVTLIITIMLFQKSLLANQIACAPNNVSVIDADTIKVCNTKIRLSGISAAERGHKTYQNCKDKVENIIKQSDLIVCLLTGEKTYDRFVGTCFMNANGNSINLQKTIVENHCARDCRRYSNGKYAKYETPQSKKLPIPNYCQWLRMG